MSIKNILEKFVLIIKKKAKKILINDDDIINGPEREPTIQ